MSDASQSRWSQPAQFDPCVTTYPKVGLWLESLESLVEGETEKERDRKERENERDSAHSRVELDRTENLNLASTQIYTGMFGPRGFRASHPVPFHLLVESAALVCPSLFISSWKLPPFTCPSHLAFLPPAANRPNPLQGRTVFSPAVGCRLLSTRDMRSEPRNDRCALRQRRSRIA